jgi:hypothetical protein
MTHCATKSTFGYHEKRRIEADFSGGDLSSDGGVVLLSQLDSNLKLIEAFERCIHDPRVASKVKHSQLDLLRQRIFQICAGHEDANDCDELRHDPMYKVACHRLPQSDEALGSQPTMTRLENRVDEAALKKMRRFFMDRFIAQLPEKPTEIVLDIDGFADETYGQQELSFYHGYHGHHMYHPVLISHAPSKFPLALQLRAGNVHAGKGVKALLRWIFWRLHRAFPEATIVLRGDAGFSLPEVLQVCERSGIDYVLGYSRNKVIERKAAFLMDLARLDLERTGLKARLFDDYYYAAGTWDAPRRLVVKAEQMPQGSNLRCLITNRFEEAQQLYETFYVQRAEDSENLIKDLKLDMKADRLSCHGFMANQFRLHLHQVSLILMQALRRAAKGTCLRKARSSTLRKTLLKQAVRVRESARRIWVQFSSSSLIKDLFVSVSDEIAFVT